MYTLQNSRSSAKNKGGKNMLITTRKRGFRLITMLLTALMLLSLAPAALAAQAECVEYPVEGGNLLFDISTGTVTDCDTGVSKAVIPSKISGVAVKAIGDNAFRDCRALVDVSIPDSVESIGAGAFAYCEALTDVVIPDSVTSIGGSALSYCIELKSVTLSKNITSIGSAVFGWCGKLEKITVPDGVTSIEGTAFVWCEALKSVAIPKSVKEIGKMAFWKCTALSDVYYGGTQEEWNAVTVGDGNEALESATVHCVSELGFLSTPDPVSVPLGETARFTVKAAGDNITYRWQYSTDGGNTWKNVGTSVQGAKTDTLTFTAAKKYNGYMYRCTVKDGGGNTAVSDGAKLTVTSGPVIIAQPEDCAVSGAPGGGYGSAYFTVKAKGDRLTYCWQYSKDGGNTWKNVGASVAGARAETLSFKMETRYNGYMYRCAVKDASGDKAVSESAKLTARPWIAEQPVSVDYANVGDEVTFSVNAVGVKLKYQWQYSKDGKTWKNVGKTIPGARTAKLTFTAQSRYGENQYRCVITDANGEKIETCTVSLSVYSPR